MNRTPARGRALVAAVAIAVGTVGAVVRPRRRRPAPADPAPAAAAHVDQLQQSIARAQERLRRLPGDWQTWAALSLAYLEESRITADPTWYPKAQEAARAVPRTSGPTGNLDALVAQGALANARHDFAAARTLALTVVIAADPYRADAYAVLTDAETQLGHRAAATAAVQRLLDLRPGLSGYARASYDLEQRGQVGAATDLMSRALAVAVDRHDIAFGRTQLGDLALQRRRPVHRGRALRRRTGRRPDQRGAATRPGPGGRRPRPASTTRCRPTPRSPGGRRRRATCIEYAELLRAAGRPDAAPDPAPAGQRGGRAVPRPTAASTA